MARLLRWTGYVVIALLLALLFTALWVWFASESKLKAHVAERTEHLAAPSAAQLADAPRQLRLLGCSDCHGDGVRGALMFDEPNIARVYAPNLTLSRPKPAINSLHAQSGTALESTADL
jgi:cytochrome c553